MSKVVQISIIGKIYGNVNADEVVGTRITLKKMYSSSGEVLPFVSSRAIKFAIRKALKEKGFEIDPLEEDPKNVESLRLADSGDPSKYIDNDLFGYMKTIGRGEMAIRRQAPIALSYFKALKDTPIKAEFAARFPRSIEKGSHPVPFEVEVAEFIGKLNCLIYDYVGDFTEDKKQFEHIKKDKKDTEDKKQFEHLEKLQDKLDNDKRKERLRAFLEVLLTPSYVLPRRTNSLNIPEYFAALVVLSNKGPLPVYQYLDYNFELNKIDEEKLKLMASREEFKDTSMFFIDYVNSNLELPNDKKVYIVSIEKIKVSEVINKILNFLIE